MLQTDSRQLLVGMGDLFQGRRLCAGNQNQSRECRIREGFHCVSVLVLLFLHRFIESMCQKEPQLKMAQQLSLDFYRMLKTKNKSQLNQWFSDVSQSGLIDLQRVAAGMEADATAIHEAISSRWSNGVVEGHVNRLKMLKRQMYGRAGFELLRRRVMSPLA